MSGEAATPDLPTPPRRASLAGAPPSEHPAARARALRPAGWSPPGPSPRGADGRADLVPGADEDLCFLSGDFRIFQRKNGHRWSLDDFVTATIAIETMRARTPRLARAADLGCGIGSVLMMVAWAFPEAHVAGVEAQELSLSLARRSVAWNGLEGRSTLQQGDLRDPAALLGLGPFDLVTGTPPYIPQGSGLVSGRIQREPCFFETRGGIEDYALGAARLLREGGVFVACAGAWPEARTTDAARQAGLVPTARIDVIPREGKPVLFRVVVAERRAERSDVAAPIDVRALVVRDRAGAIAPDMHRARALLGMPPVR
ncbi:MAG TPA: methyltransferase [Polyangiaceae bacterium]|nr:methyltransferase [Polyangiaceae bacterium]